MTKLLLCDRECVALHRHHSDHIPAFLQPLLRDKTSVLAGVAELETIKREGTPIDYRYYVRERDEKGQSEP